MVSLRGFFRGSIGRNFKWAVAGLLVIVPAVAECRMQLTSDAHSDRGVALEAQGKLDEAIVEYRQGLRIEPDNAELHFGLGLALSLQGKHDEAIAEYREAVRINPSAVERS